MEGIREEYAWMSTGEREGGFFEVVRGGYGWMRGESERRRE